MSVQPLSLPPYATTQGPTNTEELAEFGPEPTDGLHSQIAGEDGLGVVPERQGWDTAEAADPAEDEELGWLEDDEIEDWD